MEGAVGSISVDCELEVEGEGVEQVFGRDVDLVVEERAESVLPGGGVGRDQLHGDGGGGEGTGVVEGFVGGSGGYCYLGVDGGEEGVGEAVLVWVSVGEGGVADGGDVELREGFVDDRVG